MVLYTSSILVAYYRCPKQSVVLQGRISDMGYVDIALAETTLAETLEKDLPCSLPHHSLKTSHSLPQVVASQVRNILSSYNLGEFDLLQYGNKLPQPSGVRIAFDTTSVED